MKSEAEARGWRLYNVAEVDEECVAVQEVAPSCVLEPGVAVVLALAKTLQNVPRQRHGFVLECQVHRLPDCRRHFDTPGSNEEPGARVPSTTPLPAPAPTPAPPRLISGEP